MNISASILPMDAFSLITAFPSLAEKKWFLTIFYNIKGVCLKNECPSPSLIDIVPVVIVKKTSQKCWSLRIDGRIDTQADAKMIKNINFSFSAQVSIIDERFDVLNTFINVKEQEWWWYLFKEGKKVHRLKLYYN